MAFTTLISVTELAKHIGDPAFAIFDCRFKLDDIEAGRRVYYEAHVPGAVYAHLDYDLSGWKTGANGRHPLPTPQMMNATFGAWGISADTQVAAYDDQGGGMGASRLWWMLRYMGHEKVAVLDGGWQAWESASLPTESGIVMRPPTTYLGQPRPDMRRDADEIANGHFIVIDARSLPRHRGDEEPLDPVAGRIPGSRHHFYLSNLGSDGRMLPPEKLRAKFQSVLGDAPADHCVFYCGSGVSAAFNVLAMEVAGMPGAKMYPGSWSEWIGDPNRPVARGD